MITSIEIDGFKTFKAFKVEFNPLQVIVGVNGVGKSNLFDALRLLSSLAEKDLRTSFLEQRGEAGELFSILPYDTAIRQMRFQVEMLVDRQIQDSLGETATLRYNRFRYVLNLRRSTHLDRVYVEREYLSIIPESEDEWAKTHGLSSGNNWLGSKTKEERFFITGSPDNEKLRTISLLSERVSKGRLRTVEASKLERTMLSSVTDVSYPHAFAVREEMRKWQFLQLDLPALREPGRMIASPYLADNGANLPTVLNRLNEEAPYLLTNIGRDLANLVPGIVGVEVEADNERERYIVRAKTQDGRTFAARVLSDGTLRMLVLSTLKNDPQLSGLLCLEEPENGVHPACFKYLAQLFTQMVTDFSDPEQQHEPLRQLLVNTHSPTFVSQEEIVNNLLVAYNVNAFEGNGTKVPVRVTRMEPVILASDKQTDTLRPEQAYTLAQVIQYLNGADLSRARHRLEEARS
ncbi:MAG TPA: AAA family ATPase [Chloroflexia bacterium]|nr:AAA family ATPase [Chloroflexia bacterium]